MNNVLKVLIILLIISNLKSCTQGQQNSYKMTITYVMDPQCGWCYGNSENISQLKKQFEDDYEFELLVGGMWLGQNAPKGSVSLSQYIQTHASRMAHTTGAEVGQAYYDLAKDSSYIFSSLEPSAAIVAVKQLKADSVFKFARKIQELLLLEGQRLDQVQNYYPILDELNIPKEEFKNLWLSKDNLEKTQQEFIRASSRTNGFPALLLQDKTLKSGYFDLESVVKTLSNN